MTTITTTRRTADVVRLPDLVARSAHRYGGRVALESPNGDRRVTFAELHERARRGAGVLRDGGLSRGDRVLLALDGGVDWVPALFSILAADLVAVPIPASTPAALVALAAGHTGASACVADAASALRRARTTVRFVTPADLDAGRLETATPCADATDAAVLAFTSGSTASPRAVALSHANLLANVGSILAVRSARPAETLLSVLPPSHLYELTAGQLAPISIGARIVYAGVPLPNRILSTMRARRVTRMLLVPALLEALGRELIDDLVDRAVIDVTGRELSIERVAGSLTRMAPHALAALRAAVRERVGPSLETLVVGGAAVRPAWGEVLQALGIGLDIGYGLTEAGPLVSVGSSETSPAGSVGRPLPGVDVRMSAAGEILVRSDSVTADRGNDPDRGPVVDDEGWLRTGDRGRLDAGGFLFVTGRIKEAIVSSNGETVYPEEVEPWYASPVFAEHCVVPVLGADGNDVSTLVIVAATWPVNDALVARTVATLRAAAPANCRVAAFRCLPDSLPRTALGKVRRRALAQALHVADGGIQ